MYEKAGAGQAGGQTGEPVLNGDTGSIGEEEKVLETDGGDGCTMFEGTNATELCTYTWFRW